MIKELIGGLKKIIQMDLIPPSTLRTNMLENLKMVLNMERELLSPVITIRNIVENLNMVLNMEKDHLLYTRQIVTYPTYFMMENGSMIKRMGMVKKNIKMDLNILGIS